jgi:hypothetical protein
LASRNKLLHRPIGLYQGIAMTNFRKAMTAMVVVAAMAGSQALAADGALPPGKPAGVQEARMGRPNLLMIAGGVVIAVAGIAVAMSGSNNAACSATNCPTTVTPSTTS